LSELKIPDGATNKHTGQGLKQCKKIKKTAEKVSKVNKMEQLITTTLGAKYIAVDTQDNDQETQTKVFINL